MSLVHWALVISLLSFGAISLLWARASLKNAEMRAALDSIRTVSDRALWESRQLDVDERDGGYSQRDRLLGVITTLRTVSEKYARRAAGHASELVALMDRGILLNGAMLWDVETAEQVGEIWILTHDLEPDSSDVFAGVVVKNNLERGKRYVYFYPAGTDDETLGRLLTNIGVAQAPHLRERVKLVAVDEGGRAGLFDGSNRVLYFRGLAPDRPQVYEEIRFTNVSERAAFWRAYPEDRTLILFSTLDDELKRQRDDNASGAP